MDSELPSLEISDIKMHSTEEAQTSASIKNANSPTDNTTETSLSPLKEGNSFSFCNGQALSAPPSPGGAGNYFVDLHKSN